MAARPKLLDKQQSAELAGVSPETIKKYISYGLIEPIEEDDDELIREIDILSLFQVNSESFISNQVETSSNEEQIKEKLKPIDKIVLGKKANGTKSFSKNNRFADKQGEQISTASKEVLEINKALKERVYQLIEERNWLRERLEKAEKRLELLPWFG